MLNFSSESDPVSEQSLEINLAAAPAAELAWVSSYADLEADDLSLITQTGTTNSTTAVTIVSPPPDTDSYQLKAFNVKNQNAAAATVIIQYNDNATIREILRVTLNQHDSLIFELDHGWYVLDVNGNIKQTFGGMIVEEDDLSPAYSAIHTLQFDKDEFIVSQPASGVAKINAIGGGSTDNDARILAWILSK